MCMGTQYIQGIIRDITERKQLEALRAGVEHAGASISPGKWLSGMAHELSQPLTACNNYLDACLRDMDKDDWDRKKLHDAVRLAHVQAERAGRIISHLKDMVKKKGSECTLFDVNLLVTDVLNLLEDEIRRQGISVVKTIGTLAARHGMPG